MKKFIKIGFVIIISCMFSACELSGIGERLSALWERIGGIFEQEKTEKPLAEPEFKEKEKHFLQTITDNAIDHILAKIQTREDELKLKEKLLTDAIKYQEIIHPNFQFHKEQSQKMRDYTSRLIIEAYEDIHAEKPRNVNELRDFARNVMKLDKKLERPEPHTPFWKKIPVIRDIVSKS
jgi:hypothetical protein